MPMNRLFPLTFAFLSLLPAFAATGPIRVLHLGKDGTPAPRHAHVLMREMGRDAVWFDYTSEPALVLEGWRSSTRSSTRRASFGARGRSGAARGNRGFPSESLHGRSQFLTAAGEILGVGDPRRREWKVLAQREPRFVSPIRTWRTTNAGPGDLVAAFRQPYRPHSVPVDLRLELFAAEPDIAKPISFAWDEPRPPLDLRSSRLSPRRHARRRRRHQNLRGHQWRRRADKFISS